MDAFDPAIRMMTRLLTTAIRDTRAMHAELARLGEILVVVSQDESISLSRHLFAADVADAVLIVEMRDVDSFCQQWCGEVGVVVDVERVQNDRDRPAAS